MGGVSLLLHGLHDIRNNLEIFVYLKISDFVLKWTIVLMQTNVNELWLLVDYWMCQMLLKIASNSKNS